MEHNIKIEQNYFGIPIQPEQPEETLEIFLGDKKLFEFHVPVCKDLSERKYAYYSYLNVEDYNCVAVVTSYTYNSDGIMFEYTQSRHRPDYFRFQDNAVRRQNS